jgi:endonuclease/exonuclease/phosphatase family metal-dependent hydrolase
MQGMSSVRAAIVVVALVLVAAACAPSPTPALPPGSEHDGLRVMTYNVLGMQADSQLYREHAGWAARVDQLRPDVLVVQEVQSDDVSALRDLPATEYVLAAYQPWACDVKPSPEGVAILVRAGLDVLGGGGRHLGSSCVDPTVRRVLVWAEVQLESGPFRIYGTHLTSGEGAAEASRNAQIGQLRSIVDEDDPAGAGRWVLAGDFNVAPDSAGYRLLVDGVEGDPGPGPLLDTFVEAHPGAADPSSCPTVLDGDALGMQALLADPQHVRDCGYTAGWAKDDNWIGCDLLSLCTSWERRRDTSVRMRIDGVLRPAGGPVEVLHTFVPNRADADWAAPGAEWFRLSDHLPSVVDLAVG